MFCKSFLKLKAQLLFRTQLIFLTLKANLLKRKVTCLHLAIQTSPKTGKIHLLISRSNNLTRLKMIKLRLQSLSSLHKMSPRTLKVRLWVTVKTSTTKWLSLSLPWSFSIMSNAISCMGNSPCSSKPDPWDNTAWPRNSPTWSEQRAHFLASKKMVS